jgi:hypothetical protein
MKITLDVNTSVTMLSKQNNKNLKDNKNIYLDQTNTATTTTTIMTNLPLHGGVPPAKPGLHTHSKSGDKFIQFVVLRSQ